MDRLLFFSGCNNGAQKIRKIAGHFLPSVSCLVIQQEGILYVVEHFSDMTRLPFVFALKIRQRVV